ncbi:MAG TPA: LON peptidase substrate-binding domain-containing protein [Candidatus Limnocylindria bacterium]|nr:LON peptidase substrate-binding domain-containing protein [Candidatus Limnocylindria bacterium]
MAMTIPQITLPDILRVFPLTGVMLLPGTVLPLHIFEPRYRAMVEDALDADKVFGMIQPFAPQNDNRGPEPGAENAAPDLYKVGCAGYIEKCDKLPDGRFFVQLKGVNRFRITEEIELQRGYRRVKAAYKDFPDASLAESWQCDRPAVIEALAVYGKAHGMQVRPDQAEKFSDLELVNLLGVSLPFHPAEKQALLEAATLKDRENMLIDLLRLGAGPLDSVDTPDPRTLN